MDLEIYKNIDECFIYNYSKAQGGEIDYLYKDSKNHGKGVLNNRLATALLNINEELQGDSVNDIVYTISALEIIKIEISRLEWALRLSNIFQLIKDKRDFEKVFKSARIPANPDLIKSKIGQLTTQFKIKHKEYENDQQILNKNKFSSNIILNSIANINIILEGNFINAKSTTMRDFQNYSKLANDKIERLNKIK